MPSLSVSIADIVVMSALDAATGAVAVVPVRGGLMTKVGALGRFGDWFNCTAAGLVV